MWNQEFKCIWFRIWWSSRLPYTKYKKLRQSSPDVDDSGKEIKTETNEIETRSLCDLPSLTEENNEVEKSIQKSTCNNIFESAELVNQSLFIDKKDFDISDNLDKEQIVIDARSIEQNCETSESDTKSSSKNDEIEKTEYVYRLL